MSSTFKLHSDINEVTPWNAQYSFPTQSSKVAKQCVKLVPKNAATFTRTQKIRIEFPAENYLNVLNSVLLVDVTTTVTPKVADSPMNLTGWTGGTGRRWTAIAMVDDTAAAAGNNQPLATTAPAWPTTGTGYYNAGQDFVGCIAVLTRVGTTEKYYNVITRHAGIGTESARTDMTFAYDWPVVPSGNGDWSLGIYPNVSFQRGGAHNLFSRLEVKYGSITIEDIQDYARLVRLLYEVGVQYDYSSSHGEILDGMATTKLRQQQLTRTGVCPGDYSGLVAQYRTDETLQNEAIIPESYIGGLLLAPGRPRTFALNLMTGLFTQKKLIPLKWLAAQLVIELTVANEGDALLAFNGHTTVMNNTSGPFAYAVGSNTRSTIPSITYTLSNVSYLAELLNFDSSFDTAFYAALQSMGIPIKFSSWHQHVYAYNSGNAIYQIHERSRSVKAAFAVSCNALGGTAAFDRDVFFFDQGQTNDTTTGLLVQNAAAPIAEFWWRIGGRYFPSQPVRCYQGAPEAFIELSKALDNLGDYTRGSQISARRWAGHYTDDNNTQSEGGGEAFIMACGFENVDVMPGTISGINAEEQSDVALNIKTRGGIVPFQKTLVIFMYYDCVMVVQAGNNVVLLQ